MLDGHTRGRAAMVHAEGCPGTTERAHLLGTMQALDALARPGTTACTVCDAAETLLPILATARPIPDTAGQRHRTHRAALRHP
ncbi:DUF6233 domain-containing protein [Streptomyces sp. NPDC090085]|uniref:DUF6233 domain-containing protein n=1 Tax=Streptomyces sp. NPDC090085 TaxID=3365943 RepID=UPI0037FAAF59